MEQKNKYGLVVGYNNLRINFNNYEHSEIIENNKSDIFLILLCGAVIGFINGFFGGGGGMVCVSILMLVLKLPEKIAHATTILIILPMSFASFMIYLFRTEFNFVLSLPIVVGFVAGGAIGALLLKKINNMVLQIIFIILIMVAGVLCIVDI